MIEKEHDGCAQRILGKTYKKLTSGKELCYLEILMRFINYRESAFISCYGWKKSKVLNLKQPAHFN